MSLNEFMHPRNLYKNNPPDFEELSKLFPNLKDYVQLSKSGKAFINFRSPNAVRTLSISLLDKDFNLKIELPKDRLAPAIPLRLNYLLWAEDLIQCTEKKDTFTILDIGCGSSCIYPLLGCRLSEKWNFIATELDEKNYNFARSNVDRNELGERISVVKVSEDDPLLSEFSFDLCMCNPPFFESDVELLASPNYPIANSSCSGSRCETVGGDYRYAVKIFEESLKSKQGIGMWFTIMLGKKSSFLKLKTYLCQHEVQTTAFTEFCQGRTMRWGVAWSFTSLDTSSVIRPKPRKIRSNKELSFYSKFSSIQETVESTKTLLNEMLIDHSHTDCTFFLVGNLCASLPSRKERRKQKSCNGTDAPMSKKAKVSREVELNEAILQLNIVSVSDKLIKVELQPLKNNFPDLINRFYMHINGKL